MAQKLIIYHCYGGAHSSVVAAAIHLNKLDAKRIPTTEELLSLSLFDRQTKDGHGRLNYYGCDEWGNMVFSVGCRSKGPAMETFISNAAELVGLSGRLIFVDTLHCVTFKMRLGGYISRRLGLIKIGRPLVASGTRAAFPRLVELVGRIKALLQK